MNEDLISYYAQRANEYDLLYQREERSPEINKVAGFLQKELAARSILEIACGTGYWTRELSGVANRILATDINREVLQLAKARCNLCANVHFQVEDIYSLSGVKGTFDAGLGGYIWSHVPKERLNRFLDIFHSRLEKGACVVFIDNNYVLGSSTPIYKSDDNGNTYQRRQLGDGSTHLVLKNFPLQQEIEDSIKTKAGDIKFVCFKYYWILSYRLK